MDTDTEQAAPNYAPPLDRLLTKGEPEIGEEAEWPDYVQELELGPQHIPDLIRLATDEALRWPDEEEEGEAEDEEEGDKLLAQWAPVYAWRALGQLQAAEAGEPLLALFKHKDDEWVNEEVPETYGLIGPTAIPALTGYLGNAAHGTVPRMSALSALEEIAKRHPESYDTVVDVLMRQLETSGVEDVELNAFLVSALGGLKADRALPLIEQAFAENRVATWIIEWVFVQRAFGLITPEEAERQWDEERRQRIQALEAEYLPEMPDEEEPEFAPILPLPGSTPTAARTKAKAKRKMAEQSRKKNKKRK